MPYTKSGTLDPTEVGGDGGDGDILEGNADHTSDKENPGIMFARAIPVMALKLESRACGLLAAWVRDTAVLVDALSWAHEA